MVMNSQASVRANPDPVVKNFRVYFMHQGIRRLTFQVPFNPDHVFILNQTPATLYLIRGGQQIPNILAADLIILPDSYYNFRPQFAGYLYSAVLDFPGGYTDVNPFPMCKIIFAEGYTNYALKLFPNPDVVHPLNPIPDPLIADFTWSISPLTEALFEFGGSDYGFIPFLGAVYTPGVGFQNDATTAVQIAAQYINSYIDQMDLAYQVTLVGVEPVARTLQTTLLPSFTGHEIHGDIITDHSLTLYSAAFDGTAINGINAIISGTGAGFVPGTITIYAITLYGEFSFGADVQFTDTSYGIFPPIAWNWDFGDGSPQDFTQNPLHHYLLDGIYTVTLQTSDINGNNATISQDVYIGTITSLVEGLV